MALNNVAADALAAQFCTALGITDPVAQARWKTITEAFYIALKTDIIITILSGSIVTTGSATTQAGPAAPIPLSPL